MALFSHPRDAFDLHGEIAALRKEISALGRTMSKRGAAALRETNEGASHLQDEVLGRVADALPVIRRRAHDLEETIRENPTRTVAVLGLAALAVAAAMMLSGGSKR